MAAVPRRGARDTPNLLWLRHEIDVPYCPKSTMDHLLTVKEVAALLRVSSQTLYKMLEQGGIPAVKVGSQWRFEREKVRAWLESQESANAPPRS